MHHSNQRTSTSLHLAIAGTLAIFASQNGHAEDLSRLELTQLMSMDVLLVNAQKRSENVTEVPISMTVLKADTLARSNLDSSYDLQSVVPGLITSPRAGIMLPYIRGVGTDNANEMEPSVSVYVDEIYQIDNVQNFVDLADVEQIEVLRGPQGTLYGRNTTGGAINITTRGPSSQFQGSAEVQAGNLNLRDGSMFVSGPLHERVRASFSAHSRQRDSYYENTLDLKEPFSEDFYTLRSRVQFDLSDSLGGELLVRHMHRDDAVDLSTELSGRSVAALLGAEVATRPYTFSTQESPDRTTATNTALKFNWRGESVNARSITSYNDVVQDASYDLDASVLPLFDVNRYGSSHAFTQELQFTPADEHERIDWLAGIYYLNSGIISGPTSFDIQTETGSLKSTVNGGLDTTAFAVFGEGTFAMTDAFSITAGARYNNEHKRFAVVAPLQVSPDLDERWQNLSYRLIAKYSLAHTMLYAKTETGFKSDLPSVKNELHPEKIRAYEIGTKHTFTGAPVQLNAAAFFNDYEHLQLAISDLAASNTGVMGAPPDARTYGIDASIDAKLNEHWMLSTGATWLEATYRNFYSSVMIPSPVAGNVATPPLKLDGNYLSRSPRFTANMTLSFDYPLGTGSVFGSTNYYRASRTYFEPSNMYSQSAVGLVNARLGYRSDSHWHAAAWAKNLTDETYLSSKFPNAFGVLGLYAEPRTYGLNLGYSFGQ